MEDLLENGWWSCRGHMEAETSIRNLQTPWRVEV